MNDELTKEEEEKMIAFRRAEGDCICNICGKKYYDHKAYELSRKTSTYNRPWLKELCNGDLVKL